MPIMPGGTCVVSCRTPWANVAWLALESFGEYPETPTCPAWIWAGYWSLWEGAQGSRLRSDEV